MKKKTICFIACISLLMMVLMLPACGGGSEQPIEEKLKVEEGWTIEEGGGFTYAFVFENTSDEVLSTARAYVSGYDAEGNKIDMGDFEGSFMSIGPLRPGEKTAIGEELSYTRDNPFDIWAETPVSFGCEVKNALWMKECQKPYLVIDNVEVLSTLWNGTDYYNEYSVTVRNAGEKDFDWEAAQNNTTSGSTPNILAVDRDSDGEIKGMSYMWPADETFTYPVIPAGESCTIQLSSQVDSSDSDEYLILWN